MKKVITDLKLENANLKEELVKEREKNNFS